MKIFSKSTPWKMSKYRVFSGPYFPHLEWILRISPYLVWMRENTDQKKLRVWTFSRSDHFYYPLERRSQIELTSDIERTCRASFELFLYIQFTPCIQGVLCSVLVTPLFPMTMQKRWSFPPMIFSVNMIKNCGFGHIYWKDS